MGDFDQRRDYEQDYRAGSQSFGQENRYQESSSRLSDDQRSYVQELQGGSLNKDQRSYVQELQGSLNKDRYQDDRRSHSQERFERDDRRSFHDDNRWGGSGSTSQNRGYQTREYQSQQKNSSNVTAGYPSSSSSSRD